MKTQRRGRVSPLQRYIQSEPFFRLSFILIAVGVVVTLCGLYLRTDRLDLLHHARHVTGTVIEYQTFSDRSPTYSPRVRFLPEGDTKPISIVSQQHDGAKLYKIGQEVPVLYQPGHPHRADLVVVLNNPNSEIGFFAFGGFLSVAGLFMAGSLLHEFRHPHKMRNYLPGT